MSSSPTHPLWARPVRFSYGAAGEGPVVTSATGEEILRLSQEEFCTMLRDLEIDPELERALRGLTPPKP